MDDAVEELHDTEIKINEKLSNKICEFERKGQFNKLLSKD